MTTDILFKWKQKFCHDSLLHDMIQIQNTCTRQKFLILCSKGKNNIMCVWNGFSFVAEFEHSMKRFNIKCFSFQASQNTTPFQPSGSSTSSHQSTTTDNPSSFRASEGPVRPVDSFMHKANAKLLDEIKSSSIRL